MKWSTAFAVVCATTLVLACHKPTQMAQTEATVTTPAPTWTYDEYRDEMRGTRSWSATLESSNRPMLQFPYEGGSSVSLRLSKTEGDGGDYAPELVLENGQFDCSQYSNEATSCLITIKADAGKPYDLRGVQTECGSAKCMRIYDENAFESGNGSGIHTNVVNVFRTAKRVTIELPLYEYGSYQYQFDTDGLNWPPVETEGKIPRAQS